MSFGVKGFNVQFVWVFTETLKHEGDTFSTWASQYHLQGMTTWL